MVWLRLLILLPFFANASKLSDDDVLRSLVMTDGVSYSSYNEVVAFDFRNSVQLYFVGVPPNLEYRIEDLSFNGERIAFRMNDGRYDLMVSPLFRGPVRVTGSVGVYRKSRTGFGRQKGVPLDFNLKVISSFDRVVERTALSDVSSVVNVNFGRVVDGLSGRRLVDVYSLSDGLSYSLAGQTIAQRGSSLVSYDFDAANGGLSFPLRLLRGGYSGDVEFSVRVADILPFDRREYEGVVKSAYAYYGSRSLVGMWEDVVGNRDLKFDSSVVDYDDSYGGYTLGLGGLGYVDLVALQELFGGSGDFSISLLLKVPYFENDSVSVISLGSDGSKNSLSVVLGGLTSNGVELVVDGKRYAGYGSSIVGVGWHRLTLVKSGGNLSLYVGERLELVVSVEGFELEGYFNFIGRPHSLLKSKYLTGRLAELGVWRSPLTPGQVRVLSLGTQLGN